MPLRKIPGKVYTQVTSETGCSFIQPEVTEQTISIVNPVETQTFGMLEISSDDTCDRETYKIEITFDGMQEEAWDLFNRITILTSSTDIGIKILKVIPLAESKRVSNNEPTQTQ